MRYVGGPLGLVALIERLAGKLERLGEIEFRSAARPSGCLTLSLLV